MGDVSPNGRHVDEDEDLDDSLSSPSGPSLSNVERMRLQVQLQKQQLGRAAGSDDDERDEEREERLESLRADLHVHQMAGVSSY